MRCGITNVRDELYWNYIENPKGTFTWPSGFTNYMSTLASDGITPLIDLDWSNQFYDWDTAAGTSSIAKSTSASVDSFDLPLNMRLNIPGFFASMSRRPGKHPVF